MSVVVSARARRIAVVAAAIWFGASLGWFFLAPHAVLEAVRAGSPWLYPWLAFNHLSGSILIVAVAYAGLPKARQWLEARYVSVTVTLWLAFFILGAVVLRLAA